MSLTLLRLLITFQGRSMNRASGTFHAIDNLPKPLSLTCCSCVVLEQQLKVRPPPDKKPTGKPPPAGSVSSDAPWVVQADSAYTWADGNYSLDAKGASTELGCSQNKYCWGILGIRGSLSPHRFVEKCCTTPEHGDSDLAIHKRTLEA